MPSDVSSHGPDETIPQNTRVLVKRVADELLAEGHRPTVANVRARTGRGSASTINAALKEWWQELARRIAEARARPDVPSPLLEVADHLWTAALDQAHQALAGYREEADKQVAEATETTRATLLARDEAEKRTSELQVRCDQLEDIRLDLERRLTAETERHQATETRAAQAYAEAEKRENELRERIRHLEQLLEQERKRSDSTEQRLSRQLDEQKTARSQAEARHREEAASWYQEKDTLLQQTQQAHERHSVAQGRIAALEAQLAEVRSLYIAQQTEKERLIARQAALDESVARTQKIEEALHGELAALRETIRVIGEDRDALRNALEEARNALVEAKSDTTRQRERSDDK